MSSHTYWERVFYQWNFFKAKSPEHYTELLKAYKKTFDKEIPKERQKKLKKLVKRKLTKLDRL